MSAAPVQISTAAFATTSTPAPAPAAMAAPAETAAATKAAGDSAAVETVATSAAAAATPAVLRGINISGGEFAGGHAPGTMNVNYTYPTKAEIDYYVKLGFKIIRVPFMWERLQPTLKGALSTKDRQALRDVVDYATGKGLVVVLDMHNYGQRAIGTNYATVVDVGSTQVTEGALADGWIKIATEYKTNSKVWLGLMNEPHTMTAGKWWTVAQQLANHIRGKGITNKLLVPGTAWTGAHSWVSSGNAAKAAAFKDSANNFAFEVHQYLDADSSGTSATCVKGAGARVAEAISWAKAKKKKLFMGEMGASGQTQCGVEYRDMVKRMETSGVFVGWTAWGGGTWWSGDYIFRILTTAFPNTSQTTPHMKYLLEFVKKTY